MCRKLSSPKLTSTPQAVRGHYVNTKYSLYAGIGATPSQITDPLKRKDPNLEALRKTLLGRHAPKMISKHAAVKTPVAPIKKHDAKHEALDDDDEGRGKAFVSRSRPSKLPVGKVEDADEDDEGGSTVTVGKEKGTGKGHDEGKVKRKATSYLDEILAEKSAKRKKKKKKKHD